MLIFNVLMSESINYTCFTEFILFIIRYVINYL